MCSSDLFGVGGVAGVAPPPKSLRLDRSPRKALQLQGFFHGSQFSARGYIISLDDAQLQVFQHRETLAALVAFGNVAVLILRRRWKVHE